MAYCLAHPFLSLDQLPQYEDITSAEPFSPHTTYPSYNPSIFSSGVHLDLQTLYIIYSRQQKINLL